MRRLEHRSGREWTQKADQRCGMSNQETSLTVIARSSKRALDPVWAESYLDADTGEVLPTWAEAIDQLERNPDARPAHVMRFGRRARGR
jgi:hypothetical protein